MDVNFNFISLPEDVQQRILCQSGLTIKDMGICLQVSKLFNQLASYPGMWEDWAKAFQPEGNWAATTSDPSFKWKDWVISYKNCERKTLDLISHYSNDIILKKSLENILYPFLTNFLHSDNPAIQYKIGVALINGHGTPVNKQEGFKFLKLAADQNHLQSQLTLRFCYERGIGCQRDLAKAFEYCERAAKQGHVASQNNLGVCYAKGEGCQQDLVKAFEWYELAANQGEAESQFNLGHYYYTGSGCQQDLVKAFEYFERAAKQGHASAQHNLGACYEKGKGCQQDQVKAMEYYEQAAKQGVPEALCSVCIHYAEGIGCQPDQDKAIEYLKMAITHGYTVPQKTFNLLFPENDE